jgi:hypothetical protein
VYKIFHRRALIKDGMHYTDPDILRMMMYLELSRPKGQVDRWEKVYERLQLINSVFSPKTEFINRKSASSKSSSGATRKVTRSRVADIPEDVRNYLFSFCIDNQRIILSGDMAAFYNSVINTKSKTLYDVKRHHGVVSFLTDDIRADSKFLQKHMGGSTKSKYTIHEKRGDILPEYSEVSYMGKPVAILFNEQACYSYYNFATSDGSMVLVASLDTLITMYYSIYFFSASARKLMHDIEVQIPKCVALVEKNRRMAKSQIAPFSLICKGHQKTISSLVREKVERIRAEREAK